MRTKLVLGWLALNLMSCSSGRSNSQVNLENYDLGMEADNLDAAGMGGNNSATQHPLLSSNEINQVIDRAMEEKRSAVSGMSANDALAVLKKAGHSCPAVSVVIPQSDSVAATCSDGERYRIFRPDPSAEPLAMKCSAVAAMGIEGC